MIEKRVLSLAVDFKHTPKEKVSPTSNGMIYFNKIDDSKDEREIKTMRISGHGHRAFNNGFGKKIKEK
jgi:hypothetical protein